VHAVPVSGALQYLTYAKNMTYPLLLVTLQLHLPALSLYHRYQPSSLNSAFVQDSICLSPSTCYGYHTHLVYVGVQRLHVQEPMAVVASIEKCLSCHRTGHYLPGKCPGTGQLLKGGKKRNQGGQARCWEGRGGQQPEDQPVLRSMPNSKQPQHFMSAVASQLRRRGYIL
jgi:hypothetical protein